MTHKKGSIHQCGHDYEAFVKGILSVYRTVDIAFFDLYIGNDFIRSECPIDFVLRCKEYGKKMATQKDLELGSFVTWRSVKEDPPKWGQEVVVLIPDGCEDDEFVMRVTDSEVSTAVYWAPMPTCPNGRQARVGFALNKIKR